MSRRIKDAMFMSFKCNINFHRVQNVLIRRPSSSCKDLNKTNELIDAWERMGENHLAHPYISRGGGGMST